MIENLPVGMIGLLLLSLKLNFQQILSLFIYCIHSNCCGTLLQIICTAEYGKSIFNTKTSSLYVSEFQGIIMGI